MKKHECLGAGGTKEPRLRSAPGRKHPRFPGHSHSILWVPCTKVFALEGYAPHFRHAPPLPLPHPLWRCRCSVSGIWTVGQTGPFWVPSHPRRFRRRTHMLTRLRLRQSTCRKIGQVGQVPWTGISISPWVVVRGSSLPPFHTPGSFQNQAISLDRVVSRANPGRPSAVTTSAVHRQRPREGPPMGAEWASSRPLPPCSPPPATRRITTFGSLPA